MTATDREALLRNRTAAKAKAAERIANTAWADLASGWQKAIERAMREQDAAAPVKQDSKPVSLRERLTAMREDAVRRQEAGDDSAKAIIQPAIDILDEELAKLPVDQPRDPESGQFVAEPATMRREDRLMTREEAIEFLVGNGHILKNAETEFEEEVWLERRAEGETYVVKSREKGALATFTKGPAGAARERWSAQGAAQRAVEGMRFKEAEAAPASANLKWGRATAAERREMLAAAGYTDADQARVLSGTSWSDLTDPVRKALDKKPAVTQALAEPAPPDERALQLLNKRAMSLRSLASCLKG